MDALTPGPRMDARMAPVLLPHPCETRRAQHPVALPLQNPLIGSAAMDRLVHRAVKIVIEGKSYRLDSFVSRNNLQGLTNEIT